jgi:hypothetical protein
LEIKFGFPHQQLELLDYQFKILGLVGNSANDRACTADDSD